MYLWSIVDFLNFIEIFVRFYFMFLIMYILTKELKRYNKYKILKFTQDELQNKKIEIKALLEKIENSDLKKELRFTKISEYNYAIIKIFRLYNELAVGINLGIYDEQYLKMSMKVEMAEFFKSYNYSIIDIGDNDAEFISLQMLLRDWDNGKDSISNAKRRGGYK